MIEPSTVFSVLAVCLGIVGLFWAQEKKALANQMAKRFCLQNRLQFLDGTVALRNLRWFPQQMSVGLGFRFEYSVDSTDRHRGSITLIGTQVESLYVDPEHVDYSDVATTNNSH